MALRVFLSHTSEFRRFPAGGSYIAALESAVSAGGDVVVDMREFPAIDQTPAAVCQERVRSCDVYIGIYGTRYGSPVRDRPEVSYTELEFDTASDPEHPLERLVFLLDEEAENPGIPAKWLNDPLHGERQQAFLKKVKEAGLTLKTFRNPDDLARLVERSLVELKQWRRAERERARQAGRATGEGAEQASGERLVSEALAARGAAGGGRFGVFLSYARSDGEAFANELRERLNRDLPSLRVWQDRPEIEGGVGWWRQIEAALDQVEFLVSVMTPAALASEITAREWRAARQRGVCVFPVQGPGFDFADPRLPRWMAKAHFYDLDKQWDTFLAHLARGCQAARVPFMAPDLPVGFVQRSREFEALRSLLLEPERSDPVAITTALTGAGGFGKTTLAAALCHDDAILQAFDDGILWTTLGETPNLTGALAKLYAGLTGERPSFRDAEDAATCLAEKLQQKTCLIVIDDVWDPAHLRPFLRGGEGCARLITSRLLPVATEAQASTVTVDEMSGEEAVAMLTARLPERPTDLGPFQALVHALGEWPLLLKLAAGAMAELVAIGATIDQAVASVREDLAEEGITSWDRDSESDRHAAVARTPRREPEAAGAGRADPRTSGWRCSPKTSPFRSRWRPNSGG